ncbi:helix-turn-helix domain-containing protein [Streptomyces sp. NPDC058644]|uniref:helix-turn-helix domain-containing protein n=1 Tax=unclassified Streptomyces TaxID=2593676 RepID=UPI0036668996
MPLTEQLRATVATLLHVTGQTQADLAAAIGVSQPQVSRRQSGSATWSLHDCEVLAAHFGIHVMDLLAGPTRACQGLGQDRACNPQRQVHAP